MPLQRNPRLFGVSLLVLFGLVAVACGGGTSTASEQGATDQGAEAVEADLFGGNFIDLNGQTIDLASFEGQDTVLWFWAPW